MAWRNTQVNDQRKEFIERQLEKVHTFSELCEEFCISRKTGYKWVNRFNQEGFDGLTDRSKARNSQNNVTGEETIRMILSIKHKYLTWGPKKIYGYLVLNFPDCLWPSSTTIAKILELNGLVKRRKYRKRFPAKTNPLSHAKNPNDVWSIDFKGWFQTKDKVKCDPLTLTDAHSRFILHCSKLSSSNGQHVWETLCKAFTEYGLPKYLRHDNGPPFATCGTGRLSRLSVRLIKAGVTPEWIDPGKPYQNGRHERMHLTLKEEGIHPLKLNLEEQQMKFKEFLNYFNHKRPHESLGQKTPGSVYQTSERKWTGKLKSPEYTEEYLVKRVRYGGILSLYGTDIFIGNTLADEYIGLRENEDGDLLAYYGPVHLGLINREKKLLLPQTLRRRNSGYAARVY